MKRPARDLEILKLFRRYFYLKARQVQQRLIPHDHDGSITRTRLRRLVAEGLLRKHQPKMVDPFGGNNSASTVYTITTQGASTLVAETNDPSYFLKTDPDFSQWMSIHHYTSLSGLAMTITDAFAGKDYVRMTELVFEHEEIDPKAKEPSDRYRLHTTVSKAGEKIIFFCPDLAIESEARGRRRGWFIEYETGSDSPGRVFHKKQKGITGFGANHLYKMIFPHASDHRVIFLCPGAAWRDTLRNEFAGKAAAEYCVFASSLDVTVEKFLHEPILYTADKGPFPLLPRP